MVIMIVAIPLTVIYFVQLLVKIDLIRRSGMFCMCVSVDIINVCENLHFISLFWRIVGQAKNVLPRRNIFTCISNIIFL